MLQTHKNYSASMKTRSLTILLDYSMYGELVIHGVFMAVKNLHNYIYIYIYIISDVSVDQFYFNLQ